MKRIEQAASAASAAKRCSASGSRSIATSVPDGPSRSARSRAWPPSPNVQSIASCPGCGLSRSRSSLARTGVCEASCARMPPLAWLTGAPARRARAERDPSPPRLRRASSGPQLSRSPGRSRSPTSLASSSVIDTRGDLRDAAQQRRSMLVPCTLRPQLQTVAHAHHDDVLGELCVLTQEPGDHDPPGRVELRVVGAAVEEALELRQPRRQGRQLRQRAPGVALLLLRSPHADARLQVDWHCKHHALGEGCPVARRHRESVLGVERMVEGAAKGDHWEELRSCLPSRDGGGGGAPPSRLAAAKIPHFLPQCNSICTFSPTFPSLRSSNSQKPW